VASDICRAPRYGADEDLADVNGVTARNILGTVDDRHGLTLVHYSAQRKHSLSNTLGT